MRSHAHRKLIEAAFKEAVSKDSAAIELHGWTRLGHFELTRLRRNPSLAEILLEPVGESRKTARTVGYAVLRAVSRASLPPRAVEILLNPRVFDLLEGELAPWFEEATRHCGHRITLKAEPGRALETFDIATESSSTNPS